MEEMEEVQEMEDMEAVEPVGEVDMGVGGGMGAATVPLVTGFPDKWGRVAAALVLAMVPRARCRSCRPTVTSFISRQQRNLVTTDMAVVAKAAVLAVVSVVSITVACDRVGEAKRTRRQGPCRPPRCAPRAVDGAGRCNNG